MFTRVAASMGMLLALALIPTGSLTAQTYVGPELAIAEDVDFGIGGFIGFDLGDAEGRFEGVASFDLYFPDGDVDYWEIDGLFRYMIAVESRSVAPFVSAGVGIGNISVDAGPLGDVSDTEVALKLGGGIKFPSETVTPFVDLHFNVGDLPDYTIRGGLAFNIG